MGSAGFQGNASDSPHGAIVAVPRKLPTALCQRRKALICPVQNIL